MFGSSECSDLRLGPLKKSAHWPPNRKCFWGRRRGMLKWFRGIDWLPITTSALILVLAIELLSSFGFPNHVRDNPALPEASKEQIEFPWPDAGGWTAIFTALLTASTIGLWT